MDAESIEKLKHRANAARFALQQATEDMNELLAEFEALCKERYPTGIARAELAFELSLHFSGTTGLIVYDGTPNWQPLKNASRERRALALDAMPRLWEALEARAKR